MPKLNLSSHDRTSNFNTELCSATLESRLLPSSAPIEQSLTQSPYISAKNLDKRWNVLSDMTEQQHLLDPTTRSLSDTYNKNIEHFIGTVKVPVGVAGPLRINGLHAHGDFLIPLATTEAALVASYNRGAQLITSGGGASAILLNEGVTRTPVFEFHSLAQAGQFVAWVVTQYEQCKKIAESTTAHGQLNDVSVNIEGNRVYLIFEFHTGDASGQNMVTIATNEVFNYICAHSPIKAQEAFLDGNLSGDKKPNTCTLKHVRGKKVSAEINLSKDLVEKYLHTTPEKMVKFGQMTTTGASLSGGIGVNAHYANALAALYTACGQDIACVAESAIGITRMEINMDGGLYACVTLPNIMVGTVGGGTHLPSQRACLEIMGLYGTGKSKALAEVTAGLCLAGELSIVGAFCAGHFSKAHQKLAR
ncbi:hydroxymethylglutaryl-CoA reductase [Vibrio sp. Of14-4]|uniref:hydroxymethylglutaryl-CoA reductase n=1 Tax=Vibrio sp. Of14-4 TaxID=2724878 RepID=UPI001EF32870|nr:hydroxymethylglutaryl-CoA reductase [Vibrio sp. Of14-4]MCG7490737.1 hydroxymethylglutaryl-CoA reductase [Vibrio sp. Of14-4]